MAKKAKRTGPIRYEAVIPFTIFVALVWAYFFFFFDNHMRSALEYVGTQANGAEVNVARIQTSFWNASLEINGIQVTDGTTPTKNKVQIGSMKWKMSWDALLRGKIVVDEASILEIAAGAPRARPGRVLPPPPPSSGSKFDEVRQAALSKAQDEFSKNVLGDVAAVLGGTDPSAQLGNIEGQLKSSARVKELQTELAKKQKEWNERIARLPQAKEVEALQTRVKAVKLDGFKNPGEVQTSLQQLDSIFKEADTKVKDVQSTSSALGGDLNTYQNALKDLEAMVQNDIKDLENRLKLPKLDAKSLAMSIFGPMFLGRVKQAESYMVKAREFMPPKKTLAEKAAYKPPTPRERAQGRNYKFGRPNSYPLFWLRKAQISSKAIPGAEFSGNLTGTLTDVTDDPPVIGRPMIAKFEGDFPAQKMMGVIGEIIVDHTTENPVEKANLRVASYPLAGMALVNSPDVKLGFDQAIAASDFKAELRGGEVQINLTSDFQRPTSGAAAAPNAAPVGFLSSSAQQPVLDEILKKALAEIPKVNLRASVGGPWTALRFDIDSSLGRDLAGAFDRQIQAKVAEARAKLTAFVNNQVGAEKEKLNAEFNKAKGQVDSLLKSKEAEVKKIKNSIEQAKNDATKGQGKKLEEEGKKALDQLKNRFKF